MNGPAFTELTSPANGRRDQPRTATGWRLFVVDDANALVPPMVSWSQFSRVRSYQPALDDWTAGLNRARCLNWEHEPPVPRCGCGLFVTRDLGRLLRSVFTVTVSGRVPALAYVELLGRLIPGAAADPPTSIGAGTARILQLQVPALLAERADQLAHNYSVPVAVHRHGWPERLAHATGDQLAALERQVLVNLVLELGVLA